MDPKVNRINVVAIYAQDLAKLRTFYEKAFDLAKPLIDAKWWVEYALGDGSHLALQQGDAAHFEGVDRQKNTVKFSIDVNDIEHFSKKLNDLGAKAHYGPRLEYGFYLAEFEDPEGNCVRLYQKVSKA
jgi:predicted enzyme related to lactoylglutathione lyase